MSEGNGEGSGEDSGTSLEADVLQELGDDKVEEIATLLGTDSGAAREMVGTTVSTLSGEAENAPPAQEEAPLQGVATLGGLAGGGLMAGVLAKAAGPVAKAVAKKTGLPPATVSRVVEMLIPVLLTVLTKRAARGTRK
ncbi:DUF937 domain-containing protein [Streptomyces sp. NBC_00203]|uniref:DUF937 domain-containing protein n=1 Tax=Streptomyces sp. NBC_00203 TaxID=2975680 RepID=UPI0032488D08